LPYSYFHLMPISVYIVFCST